MELLILGKTNKDKGHQLEILTNNLLERLGYSNLATNEIGPGGEEIDISGEYLIPSLDKIKKRHVICECKAHRNPINMPDWLKFLGKLYFERITGDKEAHGCFIALSGVNGNVRGNYRIISNNDDSLDLITGDSLIKNIKELFSLHVYDEIQRIVQKYTQRLIKELVLSYYESQVYWLIKFDKDVYTLISSKGEPVHEAELIKIIENEIPQYEFINVLEEKKADERRNILSQLLLGEFISLEEFKNRDSIYKLPNLEEYSSSEIDELLDSFINKDFVLKDDSSNQFSLLLNKKKSIEIIKQLFRSGFNPKILETLFYNSQFDKNLVKYIKNIQVNLPFSKDEGDRILQICKLSPSAFAKSIFPNPIITQHRTANPRNIGESINKFDINYFFNSLFTAMYNDFQKKELHPFYYKFHNLREYQSQSKIKLKSDKEVVLEAETNERIGIGKLTEELGGSLINIAILDDAPEPWEYPMEKSS